MVAGGGIRRQMPVFRAKTTIFAEQFQYTLSLFGLTRLNSLTEDFTDSRLFTAAVFFYETGCLRLVFQAQTQLAKVDSAAAELVRDFVATK
jgi:hypothetical protein